MYRFDGIIVDGDGAPIVGATILLYPHDWERPTGLQPNGISGDNGRFEAYWGTAINVEYFRIVVSKSGYRENISLIEAEEKELRFVLERVPDGERSR